MKYFIAAGEASGDLHASELMREIRTIDPQAQFTFLGGDMMAAEAGCQPVIHYRDMAFMGFSEVLRNLRKVFGNLRKAKAAISSERPDRVILVDYPSFNLKLAKHAHSLGLRVDYYISPKIWAWKSWRIREIRRYVTTMLSILPFEPEWYARRGYNATYVGNPSVEEVDRKLAQSTTPAATDNSRPMLLLVPGSRRGEIRNNLPIMTEVALRTPDYRVIVAGAPGIEPSFYSQYTNYEVERGDTFGLMRHATAALVTSGTATLECALSGTPQVVCYRANGSRLSYNLFKHILKVPYVSLPNLICGREIVHEALLHLCTPGNIYDHLVAILPGGPRRETMLADYAEMRRMLGPAGAAKRAAMLVTSPSDNCRC